jgi:hypothetical protein
MTGASRPQPPHTCGARRRVAHAEHRRRSPSRVCSGRSWRHPLQTIRPRWRAAQRPHNALPSGLRPPGRRTRPQAVHCSGGRDRFQQEAHMAPSRRATRGRCCPHTPQGSGGRRRVQHHEQTAAPTRLRGGAAARSRCIPPAVDWRRSSVHTALAQPVDAARREQRRQHRPLPVGHRRTGVEVPPRGTITTRP